MQCSADRWCHGNKFCTRSSGYLCELEYSLEAIDFHSSRALVGDRDRHSNEAEVREIALCCDMTFTVMQFGV